MVVPHSTVRLDAGRNAACHSLFVTVVPLRVQSGIDPFPARTIGYAPGGRNVVQMRAGVREDGAVVGGAGGRAVCGGVQGDRNEALVAGTGRDSGDAARASAA